MTVLNATDLENVSLFAQQIALTALFSTLRKHNQALADETAFELASARHALPQHIKGKALPHIQDKLEAFEQMLKGERTTGESPA